MEMTQWISNFLETFHCKILLQLRILLQIFLTILLCQVGFFLIVRPCVCSRGKGVTWRLGVNKHASNVMKHLIKQIWWRYQKSAYLKVFLNERCFLQLAYDWRIVLCLTCFRLVINPCTPRVIQWSGKNGWISYSRIGKCVNNCQWMMIN